jgi:hypothetical protein
MRVFLISVLLIVWTISNGQTAKVSGIINDASTGKELGYANIMLLNRPIGTSANSDGYFELTLADSLLKDSIIVSYVGYQSYIYCISDNRSDIIELKPIRFELSEVLVKPKSKSGKQITLNRFKARKCFVRYAPIGDDDSMTFFPTRTHQPTIEALFFPYKKEYDETRKLKQVVMKVSNYARPPTYFNLRIYQVSENMSPGEDMLSTPLIIEVTETKKPIIVDIEEYGLIMPENGLFIGFEMLIIEENKGILHDQNGNPITLYSPFLNFFSSKEQSVYWIYSEGKWSRTSHSFPLFYKLDKQKYSKPAISLILVD